MTGGLKPFLKGDVLGASFLFVQSGVLFFILFSFSTSITGVWGYNGDKNTKTDSHPIGPMNGGEINGGVLYPVLYSDVDGSLYDGLRGNNNKKISDVDLNVGLGENLGGNVHRKMDFADWELPMRLDEEMTDRDPGAVDDLLDDEIPVALLEENTSIGSGLSEEEKGGENAIVDKEEGIDGRLFQEIIGFLL